MNGLTLWYGSCVVTGLVLAVVLTSCGRKEYTQEDAKELAAKPNKPTVVMKCSGTMTMSGHVDLECVQK